MPNPLSFPPALSVKNSSESLLAQNKSGMTVTPLYIFKKSNQRIKSSLIPRVTRILWCGLVTPLVASIIRLMKARPGLTTWHAKFSEPISDCSVFNVIFFFCRIAVMSCLNSSMPHFLSGSLPPVSPLQKQVHLPPIDWLPFRG